MESQYNNRIKANFMQPMHGFVPTCHDSYALEISKMVPPDNLLIFSIKLRSNLLGYHLRLYYSLIQILLENSMIDYYICLNWVKLEQDQEIMYRENLYRLDKTKLS